MLSTTHVTKGRAFSYRRHQYYQRAEGCTIFCLVWTSLVQMQSFQMRPWFPVAVDTYFIIKMWRFSYPLDKANLFSFIVVTFSLKMILLLLLPKIFFLLVSELYDVLCLTTRTTQSGLCLNFAITVQNSNDIGVLEDLVSDLLIYKCHLLPQSF
jgi:hypothetical protein